MRNCSAMKSLYSTQNRPLCYSNILAQRAIDGGMIYGAKGLVTTALIRVLLNTWLHIGEDVISAFSS